MNHAHLSSSSWRRIRTFYDTAGAYDPLGASVRIAESIRSKSKQKNPPFDARTYCEPYSVRVQKQWLVDCDARLLAIPGGYIAEIQADQSPARQQFSICHELAHVFFNSEADGSSEFGISCAAGSTAQVLEERLCNRVAVELLMPRQVFYPHAKGLPARFASVKRLADTFQVSLQAAMKRVVELSVWPCGYVNYERSQCGGLSLQYWRVSDTWRNSSKCFYSASQLGNTIRDAQRGALRVEVPRASRSVRVEWYRYGSRSKPPLICVFLSAFSVNN